MRLYAWRVQDIGRGRERSILLIGHSLGGAAVLQAAGHIPSATALVTIGAPADPSHVAHLLDSSRTEIEREGKAVVKLAGRSFTVKKQFLDDLEAVHMHDTIGNLGRALLVCHAPLDNTVGIDRPGMFFNRVFGSPQLAVVSRTIP